MNTDDDDDALDLTEEMVIAEPGEGVADDDDPGSVTHTEPEDEFSLELEGEVEEEETPLIRRLREELTDTKRELAERRKADTPKIEVGEKPTLESCDFDPDRFDREYDAWKDRRDQAERQGREEKEKEEVRNREFQRKFAAYRGKLEAMPLPAEQKKAAEETIINALPTLLQSAIISYADDPAKVVVALHKYPQKLAQLAAEPDPIRFVLAIKELEGKLTVKKRTAPAPESETILRGSAPLSGTSDKNEAKLEKEAERTGDRSKLIAYRAQKRKAA
jgi:hypothetical protein